MGKASCAWPMNSTYKCTMCTYINLVGRVITIRSAYRGMHQGGNKSGARTGKVFVFIYMCALPEYDVQGEMGEGLVRKGGTPPRKTKEGSSKDVTTDGRSFQARRDREIPRAIYGMVIEILHADGPRIRKTCSYARFAIARKANYRPLRGHWKSAPLSLFFLDEITRKRLMNR